MLAGFGVGVDELAESWVGPAPTEFDGLARTASGTLAPWPGSLDAAGETLERWAGRADDAAVDARQAERRLAEAFDAAPVERDVLVRSARSRIDDVAQEWSNICRQCRLELDRSITTLTRIGDEPWVIGTGRARAIEIAVMAGALDLNLHDVDPTGVVQTTVTDVLDDIVTSPVMPLVFAILETARDRDLFTADGDLSDDDLAAAIDPTWAREAIEVWQRATGIDLDDAASDAIAGLIPTVAALMRADGDREWSDQDAKFEMEPALRGVLADAAVSAYTRSSNVLAETGVMADAIAAFTSAGSGDIDRLPANPTASDWSYHLHGPPSIGEQFETSVVFRTLVFDWEQLWGDDRSWLGGGIEIAAAFPFARAGKLAKIGRTVDRADDAVDLARVPGGGLLAHETAGGHTIEKHIGRTIDELQARIDFEGIGAASSFIDLDRAEAAVAGALVSEQGRVADWLSTSERKLVLDSTVDPNVGVVLRAGSSIAEAPSTVRVVLIRDDVMSTGYQIRTAFLH